MLKALLHWLKVFLSTVELRYYNFYLLSLTRNLGDSATFSFNVAAKPTHRQYIYIFVSWTVTPPDQRMKGQILPSALFDLAATCSEALWLLVCLTGSLWFVLNTFSPSDVADSAAYLIFEVWNDCQKITKVILMLRKYWKNFLFLSVQENKKSIPDIAEQYWKMEHSNIFKSYFENTSVLFPTLAALRIY